MRRSLLDFHQLKGVKQRKKSSFCRDICKIGYIVMMSSASDSRLTDLMSSRNVNQAAIDITLQRDGEKRTGFVDF